MLCDAVVDQADGFDRAVTKWGIGVFAVRATTPRRPWCYTAGALFCSPLCRTKGEADHLMDVISKQSPWTVGLEPRDIPDFLKPHHLTLAAEVRNKEYQEHYLKPMGRTLAVFEGERVGQAITTAQPTDMLLKEISRFALQIL